MFGGRIISQAGRIMVSFAGRAAVALAEAG
jgi:hypothetical protein